MLNLVFEAALRSAIMALTVGLAIRALRLHPVLAQKVAWILVLAAAVVMPIVMRSPLLALDRAIQIPLNRFKAAEILRAGKILRATQVRSQIAQAMLSQPPQARTADGIKPIVDQGLPLIRLVPIPKTLIPMAKPSAAHRFDDFTDSTPKAINFQLPVENGARRPTKREDVAAYNRESYQPQPSTLSSLHFGWRQARSVFNLIYLAIAGFLLLRITAGLAIAFRIWRRSTPIMLPDTEALTALSAGRDGASPFHMRVSPDLSTPITIGSTVLLPIGYTEWSRTKLRIVLAHECSHVRQGDFYLQLAASLHAAIFWFSPLGWWLRRKLSELGEALSDRAGLEQAPNRAAYAQVLLDFATLPRSNRFSQPLAGVAMARTNNISNRIERILNDRRSRLAFLGGRKHAFVAALLVPVALVAVVAGIRVVPAVEAARTPGLIAGKTQAAGQSSGSSGSSSLSDASSESSTSSSSSTFGGSSSQSVTSQTADSQTNTNSTSGTASKSGQVSDKMADQVDSIQNDHASDVVIAPVPPSLPTPGVQAPQAPEPPSADQMPSADEMPAPPTPPIPPRHTHSYSYLNSGGKGEDSFAIIHGNDNNVYINGRYGKDLEEAKKKYHGDFIWYEHGGKSYVITDPAIVAQAQVMFKGDTQLEVRQQALQKRMANLDQEMAKLKPEIEKASQPGPEFQEQMKKLTAELSELQTDKFKKLTDEISKEVQNNQALNQEAIQQMTQEKLGELQQRIGDIQGHIGEIQGEIGERQGRMGEKQGEIGERMGELGEQMGKIGEEQGRKAEEASRKLKSILDQAYKDGKAKPVD